MKYIQAIFNVTCDAATLQTAKDLLCALAGNAGFEAFEDDGATVTGYAQKELFSEDVLSETLRQFPIDGVEISYSIADAEDKNWNSAWEEHGFDPITIDGRCVVHDTMHLPDSIPDGAMDVTIDTKQAFGTGGHETTAMIISQLLGTDLTGKSVLDCGCGTGILSIVAAKAGAESVTGYDIDEWSVENTTHNCAINGTPNVRVVKGDASVIKGLDVKFNVVLANINRNILLADMPAFKLAMAKDGTLILSGFYAADADMLAAKAATLGLKETKRTVKNDWCMLVFENTEA